jgi:Sec-independent protein translocase protein TatA
MTYRGGRRVKSRGKSRTKKRLREATKELRESIKRKKQTAGTVQESFQEDIQLPDINITPEEAVENLLGIHANSPPHADDQGTPNDEDNGSSSPPSKKRKKYYLNRPPLVAQDPKVHEFPKHFTAKELEQKFSATVDTLKEYRVTRCSRLNEDLTQDFIDHLPFGIKLHRQVGMGRRKHRLDGQPAFISKTGLTVYRIKNVEYDDDGRIVCLHGIGLDGSLTKAWVWH